MVKRIVDTDFWTSRQVIDNYSVEDKFFALYLMTNGKTTQSGIYSLPKKVISFETGFTTDVIQVLIDRFSRDYGQIKYSEKTQEVTVLNSLSYSILKGGKPVTDLLKRELRDVEDGQLILATYHSMLEFWTSSIRKYDQTIQSLFEEELLARELIEPVVEELNLDNFPMEQVQKQINEEEEINIERYVQYLKHLKPDFDQVIEMDDVLYVFYTELLGEVTLDVEEKFKSWEETLPKSLILEALLRSVDKIRPIAYASTIIKNWQKQGVKTTQEVAKLEREYSREKGH